MNPDANSATHLFLSATGKLLPRWREAFPGAVAARPEVVFPVPAATAMVWLRLGNPEGVAEQVASVRSRIGALPLVVLSSTPHDEEAMACFAAAARGYCNAHATTENLRQVAGVVLQGGLWIGESLMQRLMVVTSSSVAKPVLPVEDAGPNPLSILTEREQAVAQAIVTGASNKEIARQLGITERTIKAHVGAILEKLQVRDRLQLALRLTRSRAG